MVRLGKSKLLEEQLHASGARFVFPGKGAGQTPPQRGEIAVGPELLDMTT